MDSRGISIDQAKRLQATVGRQLRYLNKLCKRLDHLRFPPDDPLYRAAHEAFNGVHALSVHAHYMTCESGVGQPPRT